MPIYEYKCPNCGTKEEVITTKYEPSEFISCKCGSRKKKIISLPNTDLKNNERLSSTMGVNPRQIKEAEKRFPGSKYTPDGRLIINNRQDKIKKCKERGLSELD
jgi:putative FmdB family regulatory protein